MAEIPSADEIRAIVREAVEPLRAEIARLRERTQRPLSMPEAARELGVSTRTVRRQVKAGHLRAVKVGARVLVYPEPPAAEVVALRARRR